MGVDRETLEAGLRHLGGELRHANSQRERVVEAAKQLAREAHQVGFTETELAALLGVDRAKTIRRWLGKA